jgi:hypothetical protein
VIDTESKPPPWEATVKYPLALVALLLVPRAGLHAADASPPAAKPNILVILADDKY